MAAIVGFLNTTERPQQPTEQRWHEAAAAIVSRSTADPVELNAASTRIHFRGKASHCALDENGLSVVIDGQIDNLHSLLGEGRLTRAGPAAQLRELFLEHGTDLFGKLTGDFALVLVSHEDREVHLVRDRFGTRGLFFAKVPGGWCWASEIKGLMPFVDRPTLDRRGLAEVLHYRWLVGDRTLVAQVHRVVSGAVVTLGDSAQAEQKSHWAFPWNAQATVDGIDAWVERTESALDDYLQRRISESSSVAVFLSGGVDSSLLAAMSARHSDQCFLITPTWAQHEDPEVPRAKQFAQHLGLEHRIVAIPDEFIESFFPELIWRMEQPPRHWSSFAWPPVAEALADYDTAVYGEGAGTLFGPGRRFIRKYTDAYRRISSVPRGLLAPVAKFMPNSTLRQKHRRWLLNKTPPEMAMRYYGTLSMRSELTRSLRDVAGYENVNETTASLHMSRELDPIRRYQQILIYTIISSHMDEKDRIFTPYETRVITPFLSPGSVAVTAELPNEYKLRGDTAKPVLRDLSERFYPRDWIYAPKLGLPTPKTAWLEGPLRSRVDRMRRGDSPVSSVFGTKSLRPLRMSQDDEAIFTLICIDEFVERFLGSGSI